MKRQGKGHDGMTMDDDDHSFLNLILIGENISHNQDETMDSRTGEEKTLLNSTRFT